MFDVRCWTFALKRTRGRGAKGPSEKPRGSGFSFEVGRWAFDVGRSGSEKIGAKEHFRQSSRLSLRLRLANKLLT